MLFNLKIVFPYFFNTTETVKFVREYNKRFLQQINYLFQIAQETKIIEVVVNLTLRKYYVNDILLVFFSLKTL